MKDGLGHSDALKMAGLDNLMRGRRGEEVRRGEEGKKMSGTKLARGG